ncbi:MAG TPA: carboxypeptidase regulatory-like domain-containing protein [Pyrinomonadaceae bacterium]|nr:carboxypeptidase regulatory-like domain-containing protein [Pyrinomonadaceae bacterium]
MGRRLTGTTFFIAAAALLAATAAGQSADEGRVNGAVADTNGAYVVRASVRIESGATRRELSTNDEGVYDTRLPAGTYRLTVSAPGFCPFRETRLGVEAGRVVTRNVTLRVAAPADVTKVKGGELRDAATGRPCSLEEKPSQDDSPQPRPRLASAQTRPAAAAKSSAGVLNITTQPGAVVWVDEVRRGAADAEGKLQLRLTPGRHSLRVRAKGFAERTTALLPTQRGALSVVLTQTADPAELAFQQAEEAREKGNNAAAVESYRQALKLRPRFAAAHLGLARALESQGKTDEALEELKRARLARPVYPEAWAVEGRIHRSLSDYDAALAAFARSLREARGFQPEAHTGAGLVYEEQGNHAEAAASFRKALAQLSDTEPVVYELLGRNLEKVERWKEAVAAYEKYLELAPQGAHASAINSIIDQLRQQAAESEQPPN